MNNLFSKDKNIQELVKISNELADMGAIAGLAAWDQETYMPPKGAGVRAFQQATLAGVYHEKLTGKNVGKILEKMKRINQNLNDYDKALVREMEREYERATKLPKRLVQEISEAVSRAFNRWQTAKKEGSFEKFAPDLEKVLSLKIQAAKLLAKDGQSVYDVMLDEHEPGLSEKEVERVFEPVGKRLSGLTAKLTELTKGADEILKGQKYDVDEQWKFGMEILKAMGYDLEAGRQDKSAHPFTTNFGIGDVRITTWENEDDPRPMLFATMHEAGHALYEQGGDERLERTHVAGGQGLVLHESQSRLWENMVGRSPEFWSHFWGSAQRSIKALRRIDKKAFVRAVNIVRPSLVRVEADEVTYGLHIMVRFEIERELVRGKIKIKQLPEIWKENYKRLLGVKPENNREGVLQDVHWSHGSFGYFPTYLLGTMTAAQIWRTANTKHEKLRVRIAQGDLKNLREWLRENLHKYARLYTPEEMLKRLTGEALNSRYFLEYLERKFEGLYGEAER